MSWGKCPGGTCPGGLCPRTVPNPAIFDRKNGRFSKIEPFKKYKPLIGVQCINLSLSPRKALQNAKEIIKF